MVMLGAAKETPANADNPHHSTSSLRCVKRLAIKTVEIAETIVIGVITKRLLSLLCLSR